ncbi:MAG: shikimate dehydrogenase [Chloroflexi bacterium]|nr:shikimate dehydrogenase [Chloroflexota bacterium]
MTQHVGLFGYPLSHSISPAFQQAAFDHYSLPIRYDLWPTPSDRLEAEVSKLRGPGYLGANVTVPHKERVPALLDDVDALARSVGAVNTIARKGSRLVGYNTDGFGFMKSLEEAGGFAPRNKRVLLLGAGGAARAAAFALVAAGVASLTIANRTVERARSLARDVGRSAESVRAVPVGGDALREAAIGAELIVNSTSVGMSHGDAQERTLLDADLIPSGALVFDLVYNPSETPLMKEARKAGARTLGGLLMLIYQGAAAFELWTERDAPIEVMVSAGRKALARLEA